MNRYVRSKYAAANNEGVLIAPMIERPLPKAIASAGLLAQIVIDKYVDHLPLHHQQQRFSREGINIAYTAPLPIEGVHAQSYNRCTMPWLKK